MKKLVVTMMMATAFAVMAGNMVAFAHPDHPHPTKEPTEKPTSLR